MERQEKIDKLICVLNTNIDKLEVDGTSLRFKFNDGSKDKIEFYQSSNHISEVTEPRYVFGFKFGTKVIKESYREPIGRIFSIINGSSFVDNVGIAVFKDLHNRAIENRDNKFIKKLNTFCDEEKK